MQDKGRLIVDYVPKDLSFERVSLNKTMRNLAKKYEKEEYMCYETINKDEVFTILSRKAQILYGEKCYLVSFNFFCRSKSISCSFRKRICFNGGFLK